MTDQSPLGSGPPGRQKAGHRNAGHRDGSILKLSRRGFLGASAGALVLGVALPGRGPAQAQEAEEPAIEPGTRVSAFLEIRPDGSVLFRTPFIEGGQGVFTALPQVVGEELDVDPAHFTVECAPPGPDYLLFDGIRFTGGSMSVRRSYDRMRTLGASARHMLLQAAATRLDVPFAELSTEPGRVVHAASGRSLAYGDVAEAAASLPLPDPADLTLRARADFRWIGASVSRLDIPDKATGKAQFAIDLSLDDMLHGAVQHAPRLRMEPGAIANEAQVRDMPGVHSIHRLPGAVGVLADSWWRAHRAAETLQIDWTEAEPGADHAMPADFSSEERTATLSAAPGEGIAFEANGDVRAALDSAATVVEATYTAPYLAHAQLEPPSALVRWNDDGTLEMWVPNQAPEMFQGAAAKAAGIAPEKVIIHSPMLGGFFGRHFIYDTANPFPQAIPMAKAAGRPVKLIWSREQEFLRDAVRPLGVARFRAGLDENGLPVALDAVAVGEGPMGRWFGRKPDTADSSAVEGLSGKPYAIPNRRVAHLPIDDPAIIGFWRSVGHSMNDFFSETFLDEMADAGGQDPYALRLRLLEDNARLTTLLKAVAELSGGWKRGPFTADDGRRRARGVAMASPFGSEVATIAEVSIADGRVRVHDVWVAIDPGRIVNPAIIEAQVTGAVAIGLSATLLEEVVYKDGVPQARNYDGYPILPPDQMPTVHVRIVESGAPMGGIGEPGVPGVPPSVANAVAALTGRRVRSLPLSRTRFEGAA
ncbi:xanthine dehydrogenase family protein molybdopterin-binding subunit [Roseospira marina]|uniref:Xanthine dehydrogenase family protein molybdopterin-binding subunit n=1 Tax=Roseospira marina TaxID=140057 RepID=A0A5M6I718_9PROT|nr:xanthine dehydrogenase family protein molybdopterin-binding subunit [Roseospira marina]KAA5604054.1 xanthine dehydrogenase family protein molybdopterin-binding subunit [Roseospira marina]MBB4315848.1 isoquinoline 1-oxidoreductase beta subunit [Roseospira marina]MBB5089012.1 isoquinoline 1-oxidoreductase beta subunit [Roseospira marina]